MEERIQGETQNVSSIAVKWYAIYTHRIIGFTSLQIMVTETKEKNKIKEYSQLFRKMRLAYLLRIAEIYEKSEIC